MDHTLFYVLSAVVSLGSLLTAVRLARSGLPLRVRQLLMTVVFVACFAMVIGMLLVTK